MKTFENHLAGKLNGGSRRIVAAAYVGLSFLLCSFVPHARAEIIPPPSYLPITAEQLQSFNGFIYGCGGVDGTYNAETFVWTQSWDCSANTGVTIGGSPFFLSSFMQAGLVGLVDNSGNVIGGAFALFGRIEGLGITTNTLLAAGRLLDALYGGTPNWGDFPQVQALIQLDYLVEPLHDLGTIMYWQPNEWVSDLSLWAESGSYGNHPWTGNQFFFYDRAVFGIPEPSSLALLGLGLVSLAFTRRRKQ